MCEDFVKSSLTRISSHCCDSYRVIRWKTSLESSRVTKNRDSRWVIDSSHAITDK